MEPSVSQGLKTRLFYCCVAPDTREAKESRTNVYIKRYSVELFTISRRGSNCSKEYVTVLL